jgi:hypothetical protein
MAIVSEPVQRVRAFRNAVPLAVLSAAVVLVVFGLARGMWVSNLHNGLLALAFSAVGAHLVVHQPSHRLGHLFLLTGIAEAVMFWGRQVGHSPSSAVDRWWGWLGVWPIALTLALVTLSVICFPDGSCHLVAPVVVAMGVVTVCALLSPWPVGTVEVRRDAPVRSHAGSDRAVVGIAPRVWGSSSLGRCSRGPVASATGFPGSARRARRRRRYLVRHS